MVTEIERVEQWLELKRGVSYQKGYISMGIEINKLSDMLLEVYGRRSGKVTEYAFIIEKILMILFHIGGATQTLPGYRVGVWLHHPTMLKDFSVLGYSLRAMRNKLSEIRVGLGLFTTHAYKGNFVMQTYYFPTDKLLSILSIRSLERYLNLLQEKGVK